MYKPKNTKRFGLHLQHLIKHDLWQTFDFEGTEYWLPHTLLEGIKNHYKFYADVAEWYRQLPLEDKKKVSRPYLKIEDHNYHDGDFIE